MWVTKLLISPVKKGFFAQKRPNLAQNLHIFGQFGPGHAGLFSGWLVGRLVVAARGLYLARHLFTLCICIFMHYMHKYVYHVFCVQMKVCECALAPN